MRMETPPQCKGEGEHTCILEMPVVPPPLIGSALITVCLCVSVSLEVPLQKSKRPK